MTRSLSDWLRRSPHFDPKLSAPSAAGAAPDPPNSNAQSIRARMVTAMAAALVRGRRLLPRHGNWTSRRTAWIAFLKDPCCRTRADDVLGINRRCQRGAVALRWRHDRQEVFSGTHRGDPLRSVAAFAEQPWKLRGELSSPRSSYSPYRTSSHNWTSELPASRTSAD